MFLGCTFLIGCYDLSKKEYKNAFVDPDKNKDSLPTAIPVDMELGNLHTIADIVVRNPVFQRFEEHVETTKAMKALRELENVTLFVPLDTANTMSNASKEKNDSVGRQYDFERLHNYAITGQLSKAGIIEILNSEAHSKTLKTLGDTDLKIKKIANTFEIEIRNTTYNLEITDQNAVNGIVHGIRTKKSNY